MKKDISNEEVADYFRTQLRGFKNNKTLFEGSRLIINGYKKKDENRSIEKTNSTGRD